VGIFDPISQPDPDRDERLRANGTHVEIRPAERVAHLATRALACPSCGVPVAIEAPLRWTEDLACAFCEHVAPTRDYVQRRGWPEVSLVARLG
jgi:hypothetical protein